MPAGPDEVLVIDASVATKWHLTGEEHTDKARLILRRFSQGEIRLLAPSHIRVEVPSAISAATLGRTARITPQQGQAAIEEFLSIELQTVESAELVLPAYSLVHQHRVSLYDALYLALAEQLGVPLVIADRSFYQRVRTLPTVLWLGDYSPAT